MVNRRGAAVPIAAALTVIALAACGGSGQAAPPVHPATGTTSPPTVTITCDALGGQIQAITADRAAQEKTFARIGSSLPQSTRDSMAAGAWTDPGTYSGTLDGFGKWVYGTDPVTASMPGNPPGLPAVIVNVASAGMAVQNDVQGGGVKEADWGAFTGALASLKKMCPGG